MASDLRPPFVGLAGGDPAALFGALETPCYLLDEGMLSRNAALLGALAGRTGVRILLAQKAFSNYDCYPIFRSHLAGTEASGLYEARLGYEKWPGGEVHVFSAAYREQDFERLLSYADHIVFNTPRQLASFGPAAKAAGKSVGLRINPECSTQEGHGIYDPCAPGSRLGTTRALWESEMTPALFSLLDGLHFHTLCEQDADALLVTLAAVERSFGEFLPRLSWLNLGGGHHITRPGYDIEALEKAILRLKETYDVQVYLEPGEACALNAGYLATRVLDLIPGGDLAPGGGLTPGGGLMPDGGLTPGGDLAPGGGQKIAIVDMSAACHTPDVLEMPYRPPLYGSGEAGEKAFTYRLGGPTCLAGDIIGDYSFDAPLQRGDLLLFGDMAIYTTCKNNTFNGMPLPALYRWRQGESPVLIKAFGYEDFVSRLGS